LIDSIKEQIAPLSIPDRIIKIEKEIMPEVLANAQREAGFKQQQAKYVYGRKMAESDHNLARTECERAKANKALVLGRQDEANSKLVIARELEETADRLQQEAAEESRRLKAEADVIMDEASKSLSQLRDLAAHYKTML
jgi:hypothetical protein